MTFIARTLTLIAVAGWVPVVVGVLGRLLVFRRDQHEGSDAPPGVRQPHEEGFDIPDQEPKPGDPGYEPFADAPLPQD